MRSKINKTTIEESIHPILIEFLTESNAIEREYSQQAFLSAYSAWCYGSENVEHFDLKLIKGIHKKLMIELNPRIAGKLRNTPVYIGNNLRTQKRSQIKSDLQALCDKWIARPDQITYKQKVKYCKDWHIQFELIHPFEDGNGRTGRILMNLQRLLLGLPILVIHEGVEQLEYYKWFREAEIQLLKNQQVKEKLKYKEYNS